MYYQETLAISFCKPDEMKYCCFSNYRWNLKNAILFPSLGRQRSQTPGRFDKLLHQCEEFLQYIYCLNLSCIIGTDEFKCTSSNWFSNWSKILRLSTMWPEGWKENLITLVITQRHRGHPLSTYAKFSEKLKKHVCIRGSEMLVFRKILRTYLMGDPILVIF